MVKRIHGLEEGPREPRVFAAESMPCRRALRAGDEVRCAMGSRCIYLGILGMSADGWLLGQVLSFEDANGLNLFGADVGDLVEFRADRVLAVLQGCEAIIGRAVAKRNASVRVRTDGEHAAG